MKRFKNAIQLARFWTKVEMTTGCWLWNGAKDSSGYGHLKINGKVISAHRFSYKLFFKSIPKNKELDHLCRNRSCVNPRHLEPVTSYENMVRGESPYAKNKRKTHCVNGHILDSKNIYPTKYKNTVHRRCRKCITKRTTEWRRRKNAKKILI